MRGFTLIEVIMAVALLAMLSASLLPITGWLIAKSRFYRYDSAASLVLQEGMEIAINVLANDWDTNWGSFPVGTYHPAYNYTVSPTTWTLDTGSETGVETRYDRKIDLARVCRNNATGEQGGSYPCTGVDIEDKNSKLIITTVSWKEGERDKTIEATLLITYTGEE